MFNSIKTTDFSAIKLRLASPEDVLDWSYGEVLKPETINYRTQRPEKDGLFCERIFGPTKDWECYCGKYKKIRYKGIICDKCGVEVTRSGVRRERMGHISLAVPVTHIWFLRGVPSRIGLILGISMQNLEKIVYFASFIVTKVDKEAKKETLIQLKQEYKTKRTQILNEFKQKTEFNIAKQLSKKELKDFEELKDSKLTELDAIFEKAEKELKDLQPMQIISESIYQDLSLKYGHVFEAKIGAEAIRAVLSEIDLSKLIVDLNKLLKKSKGAKKQKLIKRIQLLKSLEKNDIKPEWMVLTEIPVIPPDLRPMVPLDGGRFATSDLNDLYRRVINRNNRLKQLIELHAPEVITRNEKRMLQEAVDALIDNGARHGKTVTASTGQRRMLKSLADELKGKQGRFRQNLLGKRVDYSGRSVIVVGPKLRLDQCGIPKEMALELYKPFIISRLIKEGYVHNVRSGSRFIDVDRAEVWDILEDIIKSSYVFLNRAPTLHRLGIQSFKPVLIEGKAIKIHPLVCSAFNADFDGDQMAVHVPLTEDAKSEASNIMLAVKNILKPATGEPVALPSQDMVWGCYYMTTMDDSISDEDALVMDEQEARIKYDLKLIKLHQKIKVRFSEPKNGNDKFLITTIGRILFNDYTPSKVGFINYSVGKKQIKELTNQILEIYGQEYTAKFLDVIKNLGFRYITLSGLSWGMDDIPKLPNKKEIIKKGNKITAEVKEQYEMGLLTQTERYTKVVELWTGIKDKIVASGRKYLDKGGPVYSMVESGARGSWNQLGQIIGMKGLVVNPGGEIIELPVKSNFKEGFDVLEYFISTHGSRKGLADTALRTANSGYLTRRLVDVSQDVIIKSEDCKTTEGIVINRQKCEKLGRKLYDKIVGRIALKDIKLPRGKKIIVKKGEIIDFDKARQLEKSTVEEVSIRSVLKCKASKGVCSKCYGWDLSDNRLVKVGTSVGVIAAQSIGEPGTQLTMRTFHTGGIAGSDITQGLPRVDEIFEARSPKNPAIICAVDGKVKIGEEPVDVYNLAKREVPNSANMQKVVKVKYKGVKEERYFFGEDKKTKKFTKQSLKVKDNTKVSRGTLLFINADGKEVTAKRSGVAKVSDRFVTVESEVDMVESYPIPIGLKVMVKDGDTITKGDAITEGSLDLQSLYKLKGIDEAQKYILDEILEIYFSQGQKLNDKHIEVIIRQMFSRMYINDPGDTPLLLGDIVEKNEFDEENRKVKANKQKPASGDRLILGISKVALSTQSFLSAASFMETAKVLIQAAITGKVDKLEGLKENVIIGRMIPAGTGLKHKITDTKEVSEDEQ
jgi:DNA-directed RNA polymerase subunit beta'